MGDKTAIQWTDATWNPVVGCSIISPACTNCYAMAQAARIQKMTPGSHYEGTTREVNGKPVWTGVLKRAPEHIFLAPLRWKKPRSIFVNSMSDLFHDGVPDTLIDDVFAVMALCPQHTLQVLTKRSKRMRKYCGDPATPGRIARKIVDLLIAKKVIPGDNWPVKCIGDIDLPDDITLHNWPLPNVWLGVTAEDQQRADERIPDVLATPAAVRFVSIEPMLGPIDLGCAWHGEDALSAECWGDCNWCKAGHPPLYNCHSHRQSEVEFNKGRSGLDWVICGGESGPDARPMHPDWVRGLRDQCAAAEVPFFFKQWGEWGAPTDALNSLDWPYHKDYDRTHWFDARTCARPIEDGWSRKYHGGGGALDPHVDLRQTPEYLDQVARCPQAACRVAGKCSGNEKRAAATWVGKRRAGRLLDGVEHNEFPDRRG